MIVRKFTHQSYLMYGFIYILAPAVDAQNSQSEFISQELTKSDRPELASARVVISGGNDILLTHFCLSDFEVM